MSQFRRRVSRFVHHPRVEFAGGLCLVCAGVMEGLEPLLHENERGLPGEIGIILFGVVAMIKALAGMVEGAELITKAEHHRHTAPSPEPVGAGRE